MIGEERVCERTGCEEKFIQRAHNQKYHDNECTRVATNIRLKQKYHARRKQLSGKIRYCNVCDTTVLSRYNDTEVCRSCESKKENEANDQFASVVSGVVFQQT